MTGDESREGTSFAMVELYIRPPLSYGVSKKAGGLVMKEGIVEGETLGELLARLEARTPQAFQHIFDSGKGQIQSSVITVVNGTVLRRSKAIQSVLADGDRITWFLTYAGG